MLERVVRTEVATEQPAAADFGQALEPGEVRPRLGELRRVVEVCADDLGGPQLALFHLAQMNEVRAGLAGFELGLVTAGSRLGERHQFAFALGIHDHGLQV